MRTSQSCYPDVAVSYCEDFNPHAESFGPRWCAEHNRIVIDYMFATNMDPAEFATLVVNHESMHWLLTRLEGEDTSLRYDGALYEWKNGYGYQPRMKNLSEMEKVALGA